MYQILIVDDEHFIREGIINSLDWKKLGFDRVMEASNGLEAKKIIDQFRPQVIITDIKMPGMDGLKVTEYAASLNIRTKVIILSGYNEFDYARKAITYGAFDFILKPSDYAELINIINMAVEKLKGEEQRDQEFLKLKAEFNAKIEYFRQSFFKKIIISPLLHDTSGTTQLKESLNLYNIKDEGNPFLILAKIDQYDAFLQKKSEEEKQLLLLRLEQQLLDYFQTSLKTEHKLNAYLIPLKDELYAVVVIEKQAISETEKMEFCEKLQRRLHTYGFQLTLSFGISRSKSSLLELNKAYLEASEALQYIFYFGKESIIFYEDLPAYPKDKLERPYLMYIEEFKPIIKTLKIGDKEASLKQLKYLFKLFEYHQENSDTVKSISIELIVQIMTSIRNSSKDEIKDLPEKLYMDIASTETNENCLNILESAISALAEDVYNETRTNHKKIVQKVLDIIYQFYGQEISLTWVASQVHLNSSYISRLLKNECGMNFTELLTLHRMEQAKQLLKDPAIKIYEASEKVGIFDAQYFSSKFKKYTGLTPSEYRDNFDDIF
jgi:two-component system response regulator YesN